MLFRSGLISAYELSGEKFLILITKAKEVADKLAFAWIDGNAMPYNSLNFTTNSPVIQTVRPPFTRSPHRCLFVASLFPCRTTSPKLAPSRSSGLR